MAVQQSAKFVFKVLMLRVFRSKSKSNFVPSSETANKQRIGKAYLRAMGIRPVLERQPKFPPEYLGYAQSAFFGGRTSAHIRRFAVPVVYTDFLSMYPTVNSLMGLWRFVIAGEIKVIEHCSDEIKSFLRTITPDDLFKPETWKYLPAFVRVIPNGDILPGRAKYSQEANDWQVGINHLYGDGSEKNALWFTLPDVLVSVLLTRDIPNIVDAFRIEPHGMIPDLKPVKLSGAIEIDPAKRDFFKKVIEERQKLKRDRKLSVTEKERLDKSLKVLANATSYGIYAEMIREEAERPVRVTCYGLDRKPFTCRVAHPDDPGEYCFPPMASLITGAARLMLALLEYSIRERGGTYAMEDTDSMAILATKDGGRVTCPGGIFHDGHGKQAVMALSWEQVEEIVRKFAPLNPYDRNAVPGSILKIEDDNRDPLTGNQRQLYCFAISAKRYALFVYDRSGNPVLLEKGVNNDKDGWKLHGLGHLLNPTDLDDEDRKWTKQVWLNLIRKSLGLPQQKFGFENVPAVGRITVSSPAVMRPLAALNTGRDYSAQIKPFNFLVTCFTKAFGAPIGSDPERFHLIAPYELNSKQWPKMYWIDQYSGKSYRISTTDSYGTRTSARVKTYREVVSDYELHPESKCADAEGNPCDQQTIGLLERRHIQVEHVTYIGKESNSLEEVEAGLIHSEESVYTEYLDPCRDEFQTKILPVLKTMPLSVLASRSGMSERALKNIRAGRSRPHLRNQRILTEIAKKRGEANAIQRSRKKAAVGTQ